MPPQPAGQAESPQNWKLSPWLPAGVFAGFIPASLLAFSASSWLAGLLLFAGAMFALLLQLAQSVWHRNRTLSRTREALFEETQRRASAIADLDRMASTDPLTGLANRRFFVDDLRHCIERAAHGGGQVALIALDLHGFQAINNTRGHQYGDRILSAVAERLKTLEDEHLLICRSSSDDYYLRYYPLAGLEPMFRVLERLRELFAAPIPMGDEHEIINASIGVALYPDHADSAEALLTGAESAMHSAQSLNGTRYQFFSESLHQQAQDHLALQKALIDGVERREFEVLFQPQKDLATGQIGSLEAKLRWRHPQRRLLGPADFLRTAIESGIISAIGRQVITAVCEQLRAWRGTECAHLTVAVNLAGPELDDPELVQHISAELTRCELAPGALELELTESSLATDGPLREQQLQALLNLGIPISIDDFGKGTASLAWLGQFPLHQIKIDRNFVQRVTASHNDSVIVRAIINLAHNLGIQVTATGVEADPHLTFLRAHRCDFAQGELISPPLWPQQVPALLNAETRS